MTRSGILAFAWACAVAAPSCTAQTAFVGSTLVWPASFTAMADFNDDGRADFLGYAPAYGNSVFLSNALMSWVGAYPVPGVSFLATGDVNGDGYQDIVGAIMAPAGYGRPVVTMLGTGSGTFWGPVPSLLEQPFGSVWSTLEDLDGDGCEDLVSALAPAYGLATPAIGRGTPTGAFTPVPLPAGQPPLARYKVADENNDGLLDLVTFGPGGPQFLYATGSGFTAGPVIPLSAWNPIAAAVGDFNGDGYVDFATIEAPSGPPMGVRLHLGGGGTYFSTLPVPFPAISPSAIIQTSEVADFDGDLSDDLLLCGTAPTTASLPAFVLLAFGGASGLGPACPIGALATGNPYAAVGDLDADGDPDLAVGGLSTGIRAFRNLRSGVPAGTWARYLAPCPQALTPTLALSGPIAPGQSFTLSLGAIAGAAGFLVIGGAPAQYPVGSCWLGVDVTGPWPYPAIVPHAFVSGTIASFVTLPASPALTGLRLYAQEFAFHPLYSGGWSASAAVMLVLG